MRDFAEIHAIAAARKGGEAALEALLSRPRPMDELEAEPDHRWLAAFARAIFQAGFSRKVIAAKWPGFEEAFAGFDPGRLAMWAGSGEIDRLLTDARIVRNGQKIAAVLDNAVFLRELAAEHGGRAGPCLARWPSRDYAGLLDLLKSRGARLGGATGQRALRAMGRDSFVLTPDVTARLIAEGVIERPATSTRALARVQAAFNEWRTQSGRMLTEISQILAFSIGE